MLSHYTIFLILFIAIIGLYFANAEDCKGCVPLDSISFDKVIPKFKTAIVKFDVTFPYGEKHEEYAKVALATKNNYDLLVSQVGVKDYGDKDNSDLIERFNIKKEDFPAVLLFVQGKKEPHRFVAENDADFNANNIKRFIKSKSGIYLGLPGCIEKLDKLAEEFRNNKEEDKKREILNKVKVFESTLPEEQQEAARFYAKAMQKILDQGDVFIQTEQTRLDGILKTKLPLKKRESMEERKNILQSFMQRDEL